MVIVHAPGARRGSYLIGEPDDLILAFPERHRTKRIIGAGGFRMREMEGTGKYDHDRVELRLARSEANRGELGFRDGRGSRPFSGHLGTIPVERSREHVRVAQDRDLGAIAEIDEEIADLRRQIGKAQKRRVAAVRRAWQRGNPWTPAAVRERAEAHLKKRRARQRAASA